MALSRKFQCSPWSPKVSSKGPDQKHSANECPHDANVKDAALVALVDCLEVFTSAFIVGTWQNPHGETPVVDEATFTCVHCLVALAPEEARHV